MDIQKLPEVKLVELYAPTETPRRNSTREPELAQQKRKQDLCEMEDYYLQVNFVSKMSFLIFCHFFKR